MVDDNDDCGAIRGVNDWLGKTEVLGELPQLFYHHISHMTLTGLEPRTRVTAVGTGVYPRGLQHGRFVSTNNMALAPTVSQWQVVTQHSAPFFRKDAWSM
jgi:hypothetical protein